MTGGWKLGQGEQTGHGPTSSRTTVVNGFSPLPSAR